MTKTSLEMIAPTVEEAIQRGALELGLPEDALDVEVLDEGGRGLFGLGSRQARVRLTVRDESASSVSIAGAVSSARSQEPIGSIEAADEATDEEALKISQETVEELLQRMSIDASVRAHWGEPDAPGKVRPLFIDILGDDLSILIGRRGETLSALQYITRLIVGKELRRPVAVLIDVEGYRARRERQLRQLARRMASQAVETARTMTLEPMPAYERRVIHMELRDDSQVDTVSVGEGSRRKVTIIPKQ